MHVSIGSRVESYKTVFGRLTVSTESLPGLKAISLFQAFSASILYHTASINLVVRIYAQPCAMSLERHVDGCSQTWKTYEPTVVWPAV